jgi:hypothetical protein
MSMISTFPRCRTVPLYQVVYWLQQRFNGCIAFDAYLATVDDFGDLVRVPGPLEGRAFE